MINSTGGQNFLQIIAKFLPTDAVQEEIDPTVCNVQCAIYLTDNH